MAVVKVQVTIWEIAVDARAGLRGLEVLTSLERERVMRYQQREDQLRKIVSRGALRCILGRSLGMDPALVPLETGPQGKPLIRGSRLQFSCSHAGEVVWIALALDCPVGIDVERIDRLVDFEGVMQQFASREESSAFDVLREDCRTDGFFTWWTRKEALLKGEGCGLLGDGKSSTVWKGSTDSLRSGTWTIQTLAAGPQYKAGLAVEAEDCLVDRRTFSLEAL
jgi:4'-phosphopantetheinyl transferase